MIKSELDPWSISVLQSYSIWFCNWIWSSQQAWTWSLVWCEREFDLCERIWASHYSNWTWFKQLRLKWICLIWIFSIWSETVQILDEYLSWIAFDFGPEYDLIWQLCYQWTCWFHISRAWASVFPTPVVPLLCGSHFSHNSVWIASDFINICKLIWSNLISVISFVCSFDLDWIYIVYI